MRYMKPSAGEHAALLAELARMAEYLAERFAQLSEREAAMPGPDAAFSPVEHCWHLADLEREGYGVRIARLLAEDEPRLADFDGARVAAERRYRERSLADGLATFRAARAENIARLARLDAAEWARGGWQEGVGRLRLCDLPSLMAEHDAAHRAEIEAWGRPRSEAMSGVILKRFESPDEQRTFEKGRFELVHVGGLTLGRATYQPGWKWSLHVGPGLGETRCGLEHVGLVVSGVATVAFDDGRVVELRAGSLFHVPAVPHDSWVVGDEPYVSLHFMGAERYAK